MRRSCVARWLPAAAALVVTTVAGPNLAHSADRRPNIVFIMADDLGVSDLGVYGGKAIRTPNLDRMAAEGLRFTQAYAGSTVCAPSRCALMTGKHMGHCRIRGNGALAPDERGSKEITLAP